MATKKSLKAAADTAGMFTQAEPEQKATEAKKAKEVTQVQKIKMIKEEQKEPEVQKIKIVEKRQKDPAMQAIEKARKEATTIKTPSTREIKKQVVIAEEKREKATFSVKIDSEVLKRWRIYSSMNGYGDKGNLTEAALTEYMNRHKLKPEQQAKFDTLISI